MSKISKIQSRETSLNPPPIQQSYVGQIQTHYQFIKIMKPFISLIKSTTRKEIDVNFNNANKFIPFMSKFSK